MVVATGPSLTAEVAHRVRMARWLNSWRVVVVNDAYRLLPHADVLYACDWGWWKHHDGARAFYGERWTSHSFSLNYQDDKSLVAGQFDLNLVEAREGRGFAETGEFIHYGYPQPSSGFQAVNLALSMGVAQVVLVGFDAHTRNGKHFFGDHPEHLNRSDDSGYRDLGRAFMPDARVVNATPGSSIEVYQRVDLEEVLRDNCLHRNGSIAHAAASRVRP